MLRVIAGTAKGRRLFLPQNVDVRPTLDRVKESVFNILGDSIKECIFLDLFAGSGSIGIEALSRGAPRSLLVERDRQTAQVLVKNLKKCGFEKEGRLYISDAVFALRAAAADYCGEKFLVYADPPFRGNLCEEILRWPELINLVLPGGRLIIEHSGEKIIKYSEPWSLARQKKYGSIGVSFFQKNRPFF